MAVATRAIVVLIWKETTEVWDQNVKRTTSIKLFLIWEKRKFVMGDHCFGSIQLSSTGASLSFYIHLAKSPDRLTAGIPRPVDLDILLNLAGWISSIFT